MRLQNVLMIILITLFISCGGKEKIEPTYNSSKTKKETVKTVKKVKKVVKAEIIDLNNKGLGPIKSIEIAAAIDQEMAAKGQIIFKNKCSSCHKTHKKFIGPNPTGIMKRRSPEWIMNMILNPDQMIREDPIAKDLLVKFNGAPMANQNLTKEDARQVLEYFRTL